MYINYQQDNWVNLLPLAEFTYNNTSHSATMVTPFFANKGFHPKLKVSLKSVVSDTAHQVATDLKELHPYLCNQISHALCHYLISPFHYSPLLSLLIPLFQSSSQLWNCFYSVVGSVFQVILVLLPFHSPFGWHLMGIFLKY